MSVNLTYQQLCVQAMDALISFDRTAIEQSISDFYRYNEHLHYYNVTNSLTVADKEMLDDRIYKVGVVIGFLFLLSKLDDHLLRPIVESNAGHGILELLESEYTDKPLDDQLDQHEYTEEYDFSEDYEYY